jgi:hypothetical protein
MRHTCDLAETAMGPALCDQPLSVVSELVTGTLFSIIGQAAERPMLVHGHGKRRHPVSVCRRVDAAGSRS